ncbi:MAG: pilus assembly protein N-terminal domain-containing protein [Burkholderiaceae bacterium]|nr:pilus assembly protein N-terminal domain-containing protein [Burkholderiaceae bacterium]
MIEFPRRSLRWPLVCIACAAFVASARATGDAEHPSDAGMPSPAGAPTAASVARMQSLELYMGQAQVIEAGDVRRIVIGNGKVIQALALDDGQVLVLPEGPGQSTLHLWGRDGTQRHVVVNVVPADGARLLAEVRAMLGPAANTTVRIVGDKVVVDGTIASDEQAMRLAEVSRRYPQVVSLVARVGAQPMIAMDVRMVEIRRDVLESLGVRWSPNAAGPSFGIVGDLHRSAALRPGGPADGYGAIEIRPRVPPFATALGLATSITSMINLLAQNGDAVVLASPTLSCRSGGSARFVAGGELPIPYSTGIGSTSVVFKEYGVKFEVSPVATESGVIAAKIATEISAVNFDVMVKEVPGLTKRRAETEVNLREHETLVIAGLLSEESSRSIDRVPALGELPVIGNLFRSRAFRDRQTELAVFVTPRFVEPQAGASAAGAAANHANDRPEPLDTRIERARTRIRMVD